MRVGILAHSFPAAFKIYAELKSIRDCEFFIILSPSPHRSPWSNQLINLVRLGIVSTKSLSLRPLQLLLSGRVILLFGPFDAEKSVATLAKLNLDVGLHKAGVVYRDATIRAFRLGILNPHIGLLPAYRGRSVVEWSLLQGDPVGITVFFIDSGIDTGAQILVREEVDISGCRSLADAKRHLFNLDAVFFRKALTLLREDHPTFLVNDGSGRRYYVISKLFEDVVEQLVRSHKEAQKAR